MSETEEPTLQLLTLTDFFCFINSPDICEKKLLKSAVLLKLLLFSHSFSLSLSSTRPMTMKKKKEKKKTLAAVRS